MELALAAAALVVGLIVGHLLGRSAASRAHKAELQSIRTAQGHDRMNFLRAVKCEIGNELMHQGSWRFVNVKERAFQEAERIGALTKLDATHEFAVLCKKYPTYDQFDPFRMRDHVLYSDSIWSREDLEERYFDIVKFIAAQRVLDDCWPASMDVGDDLEHARNYAGRIEDKRLKQRIKAAIREYHLFRTDETRSFFETPHYAISPVPHFAETRLGVFFKDTKEYGLYGAFYGDRDEPYRSYYRTDARFQDEKPLNDFINARIAVNPFEDGGF